MEGTAHLVLPRLFEKVCQVLKAVRGFFRCGKHPFAILIILQAIRCRRSGFDFSKM
jgi:hypothetical protein